jgi:hypothetical protein
MKKILPLLVVFVLMASGSLILASEPIKEVSNIKNDSTINVLMAEVNMDSVTSYIQSLQDMGTRFMIAPNRLQVAEWIRDKFLSFGVEHVRIDSTSCNTLINLWNLQYDTITWQYNVIATIPGAENTNEYYVVGAHYDNVVAPNGDPMVFAPGADDNASGVAALFEIARIFTEKEYHPVTNIELVAFGAEELMNFGNSGAQGYVANAIAQNMDIQLMLNNDMIANNNGPLWRIDVSNYYGCEWYTNMAEYIALTYTEIQPLLDNPSSSAGGDCKYFYQEGIPCVYFMEHDFNPYYHSEEDVIDHCEIDYCAEAIKISLGVLVAADDPIVRQADRPLVDKLKIYPNPATNWVNIQKGNSVEAMQYKIISLDGRTVQAGYLEKGEKQMLDIQHVPVGQYILQLLSEQELGTVKLVISR